jgi:hypothetical protein
MKLKKYGGINVKENFSFEKCAFDINQNITKNYYGKVIKREKQKDQRNYL